MSGFENYGESAKALEREIERKGVILGIDWSDEAQVRTLAREALRHGADEAKAAAHDPQDYRLMAKAELFGLAALMLKTMQESANEGFLSHGGPVWKSFARALWAEKG